MALESHEKHTRRNALRVVGVIAVVVLAVAGYNGERHQNAIKHQKAMRAYCAALAAVTDAANSHDLIGFQTWRRILDSDAVAVGGQVFSDTESMELGATFGDPSTAYLDRLRADCELAN